MVEAGGGEFSDFDVFEASGGEHFQGFLAAPHCAEGVFVVGHGDGDAVHGGIGVEKWSKRKVEVVFEVAGGGDVYHEEGASGTQGVANELQSEGGLRLVVNDVEGGNEVGLPSEIELEDVFSFEADVGKAEGDGLGAGGFKAFGGDVITGEAAGRKGSSHEVEGVSAATSDVDNVDAGFEAGFDAGDEGHDGVDE